MIYPPFTQHLLWWGDLLSLLVAARSENLSQHSSGGEKETSREEKEKSLKKHSATISERIIFATLRAW